MRKTKTTIRLAAAMLALLSQIPAAQAEDTPGGADRAEFVSLTPKQLIEVEPSAYIENTGALGGAQLFYARPRLQNENGTYTMRPASLVGASMTLVYPYNATISKELKEKKHVYCWGRLDNLDMSDTGYAVDATATRYWARPSTSFFATFWPTKAGEKIVIDFSKYKEQLAEKGDETAYEKCRNQGDSLRKRLLTLHAGAPPKDFTSCPWEDMLERRMKSSKACDGVSLDQPVVDELCKRFSRLSDTEAAESWQQVSDQKSWPKVWAKAAALDRKAIKNKKDFKEQISKRLSNPWLWTTKGIRTLNNTDSSFDGYLALKDSPYHEWDFGPKKLATDSKQKDSQPEGQPRQETLTQATEPAQQDSQLGGYHFLPVSGAMTVLKGDKQPDDTQIAKGAAVVMTPGNPAPPQAFVLAIAADWEQDSCEKDALSLNEDFQWEGGHTNPVRVPEYARVDVITHKAGSRESLKQGLNVTFDSRKKISFQWEGPVVRLKGKKQSPIAYPAYLKKFNWKAVVALPADMGDEKAWKVSVRKAESAGLLKYDKYSDGSRPRADWLPSTPYNLSTDMECTSLTPITMMDNGRSLETVNVEIPNSDKSATYSPSHKYKLYELTVTSSGLREEFHYIQSGEMHNAWVFSSNEKTCAPAVTILQKVYTIFGSSTWQASGAIKDRAQNTGKQILPWEELLNVLTREWLCDNNRNRIYYPIRNQRLNYDAVSAMAYGIKNVYNYNSPKSCVVVVDKKAYDFYKQDMETRKATPLAAFLISNFPKKWKMKNNIPWLDAERQKCVCFKGEQRDAKETPIELCLKDDFMIGGQIGPTDKQGNTTDISEFFTLLDPQAFCAASPSNMDIMCKECASILSVFPRICGFPSDIIAYAAVYRGVPHSYNAFGNNAIDATCASTQNKYLRWGLKKVKSEDGEYWLYDKKQDRKHSIEKKDDYAKIMTCKPIEKKYIYLYPTDTKTLKIEEIK